MLKQRIIKAVLGVALLLAVAGSTGIIADAAGLEVTPPVSACSGGAGAGGDC